MSTLVPEQLRRAPCSHEDHRGGTRSANRNYLPFLFLYGMWQFWILGGLLVAGGVVIGLYIPASFILGGWVTVATAR
jgi:hypothetical protein